MHIPKATFSVLYTIPYIMPIFTDLEELNSNTVTNAKSELTTPKHLIVLTLTL